MTTLSAGRSKDETPHVRELDWLMLVTMALCCLGLVMAVSVRGSQLNDGPIDVMSQQGTKLLVGLIAFMVAALTPMRVVRRVALPLFFCAVVACLLPHVLGGGVNGAARWIKLGGQQ